MRNVKEKRDHLEEPGIGGRIKLNCTFKKKDRSVWTGFIWLKTGTSVALLKTQ
jgi:hypothetical protein